MQSIQEQTSFQADSIHPPLSSSTLSSDDSSAFQQGVAEIAKSIVIEKDIDVFGDEHTIERVVDSTQYLSLWLKGGIGTGHSNSLRNRILTLHEIESSFLGPKNINGRLPDPAEAQACKEGMALANAPRATIQSQAMLNQAFGSNLIACGFNTSRSKNFPLDKAQLGTESAQGAQGLRNSLLGTPSPTTVQSSVRFTDNLREASKQEYQKVKATQGDVDSVSDHEQLLHRGKLLLASANPEQLRSQPESTSQLISLLVHLDHHVMRAQGLSPIQDRFISDIRKLITKLEPKQPVAS